MALFVNTNVSSLNAQRHLTKSTNSLDTDYRRLASGLRINSAKDDAAGLQISDRLTTQINGLNQGNRNAQDAISMLQTAEGALDEITNMLQRVRNLAIQSANGTCSVSDREAIQQEVSQLSLEINRIGEETTYAGRKLFNTENDVVFQKFHSGEYPQCRVVYKAPGVDHPSDKSHIDSYHTSQVVDFQVGADENQTISTTFGISYTGTLVHINDSNGAYMCNQNITVQMNLGMNLSYMYVGMDNANSEALRIMPSDSPANNRTTGFILGNDGLVSFDVSTPEGAQKVIGAVGGFIEKVDSRRASLGAVENRLESTIRNQSNVSENVSSARAAIRDTDFAETTAKMIQDNIMNQASSSILSQANNLPNLALSLLKNE